MKPIKLIDLDSVDALREICATEVGRLDVASYNYNADALLKLIYTVRQNLQTAVDTFAANINRTVPIEHIIQADKEVGHTLYGNKIKISSIESCVEGKVSLKFKKLHPEAKLPEYAHEGDAGMDVFALEDTTIHRDQPTLVRTGIAAEIPPGYEIQVRPRSGLALKGVTVWNSPGTIDSKYRGEIGVILMFISNQVETVSSGDGISCYNTPKRHYDVVKGDKIAQLVLAPVTFAEPYEVEELSETDRGSGGFGSTGR